MDKDRLNYLFWQRFSGKITPEEELEFRFFAKNPENQLFLETCIEQFLERSPDLPVLSKEKADGILSRIHGRDSIFLSDEDKETNYPEPSLRPIPRLRILYKWGWAAAVILALGFGTYLWTTHKSDRASVAHGMKKTQPDIAPGGDKAVLTLADGTKIILDSTAGGIIAQQGKTNITQPASGILAYNPERNDSRQALPGETLYNIINTPKGGQFRVVLPDGTKVWLNAASSIRFPTAFTGSSRTIELTGEAYLEVSKNSRQPFRVLTNEVTVDVLGTSFNINAYADENSLNTTLLEGSISVASVMLRSGQQAQIARGTAQKLPQPPVVVNDIDLERVIAWKNGRFNFNGADVYVVMRQLSRWYDLDIKFEGETPKLKLKGEMGRDLNLSEMLDLLKEMGIRFRLEGRTLYVGG